MNETEIALAIDKLSSALAEIINAADQGAPIELPLDLRLLLRHMGYNVASVGPSRVMPWPVIPKAAEGESDPAVERMRRLLQWVAPTAIPRKEGT